MSESLSSLTVYFQVEFVGEEGMDAGGVQKEFFMLLLRDMLNPEFGMFQEDEESHFIWFSDEVYILDVCMYTLNASCMPQSCHARIQPNTVRTTYTAGMWT